MLDIVQNSVEARATRIELTVAERDEVLELAVVDNGVGMDEETLRRAQDPFYTDGIKHPTRGVGLGLPFLRQLVEAVGGTFSLESAVGVGTSLGVTAPRSHWDLPPIGNLAVVFQQSLCFAGDYEMVINRRRGGVDYSMRRSEVVDALGELDTAGSQALLKDYIESQEETLE